jgi:hypothetical protein
MLAKQEPQSEQSALVELSLSSRQIADYSARLASEVARAKLAGL